MDFILTRGGQVGPKVRPTKTPDSGDISNLLHLQEKKKLPHSSPLVWFLAPSDTSVPRVCCVLQHSNPVREGSLALLEHDDEPELTGAEEIFGLDDAGLVVSEFSDCEDDDGFADEW
ncbi:hypothetical protein EDB19DRAFT_2030117 [Suillus lakei]|nr:hypothetical protein EDB19DRAFT_2030117 [Suillus lakei]